MGEQIEWRTSEGSAQDHTSHVRRPRISASFFHSRSSFFSLSSCIRTDRKVSLYLYTSERSYPHSLPCASHCFITSFIFPFFSPSLGPRHGERRRVCNLRWLCWYLLIEDEGFTAFCFFLSLLRRHWQVEEFGRSAEPEKSSWWRGLASSRNGILSLLISKSCCYFSFWWGCPSHQIFWRGGIGSSCSVSLLYSPECVRTRVCNLFY